jgi:nicotinamidase-related amidase
MVFNSNKAALLVIDAQNEYFDGKWPVPNGEEALNHIERAIDASQHAGAIVIYVQHAVLRPERGVFLPGTHGFELHPRLHPRANDPRVVKNYPGSFTKTDLEDILRQRGVETLVISGYMTHMCCDTTAREGFHRDYRVLFLDDATATRDGQHSTFGKIDHRDLHRTTLITQASTFSQVLSTEAFIQQLQES